MAITGSKRISPTLPKSAVQLTKAQAKEKRARLTKKQIAKRLLPKPISAKEKRAALTKRQIAKRLLPKPISGKEKRARLTKRQIAKRRSKGVTTASVVSRPPIKPNAATVRGYNPAEKRRPV